MDLIKAYELLEQRVTTIEKLSGFDFDDIIEMLSKGYEITPPKTPTADFVPRSEVIKEILELIPEKMISESVRYDSPYGISRMCNVSMEEATIIKDKYRKLQELRKICTGEAR